MKCEFPRTFIGSVSLISPLNYIINPLTWSFICLMLHLSQIAEIILFMSSKLKLLFHFLLTLAAFSIVNGNNTAALRTSVFFFLLFHEKF